MAPNGEPFSSSEDEDGGEEQSDGSVLVPGTQPFSNMLQKLLNNIVRKPLPAGREGEEPRAEDFPKMTFSFPMFPGAADSQQGWLIVVFILLC